MTHPPLEFAVCFSGFKLENQSYVPIYSPKIKTPILHVIGTMDTMIDPSLSLRLSKFCANASLRYFQGTHFVPRDWAFLEDLSQFVRNSLDAKEDNEDDWEDCEP
jgi:predicted esterase